MSVLTAYKQIFPSCSSLGKIRVDDYHPLCMQFDAVISSTVISPISVELVFAEMGVLPSWTAGASVCGEGGMNGCRVSY